MQSAATTLTKKYPVKPISIIVPYSAGGGVDSAARLLEKEFLNNLGQPLVVVNKPGGTGTIGWNKLADSIPDGYTLGITSPELLIQPLFLSTKYDYVTALYPLAQITATPFVMIVQTNHPWQSVDDLIGFAKQHPGQLKFGHSGVGSIAHILGETFCKMAGITMNQVPFPGAPEEISALLGGHVQVILVNPGAVKEYVKSGMVKIIAVTGEKHLTDPLLADAPTFKEQGWEIVYNSRLGIAVPKETPADVKTKLVEGLKTTITDPEFKTNIENLGLQYEYLGPEESVAYWLTDSQKLTEEVQETGIVDLIRSQKQ